MYSNLVMHARRLHLLLHVPALGNGQLAALSYVSSQCASAVELTAALSSLIDGKVHHSLEGSTYCKLSAGQLFYAASHDVSLTPCWPCFEVTPMHPSLSFRQRAHDFDRSQLPQRDPALAQHLPDSLQAGYCRCRGHHNIHQISVCITTSSNYYVKVHR